MALTTASVEWAIRRAAGAARLVEADLNAADAKMGDGDTGLTVRRLFGALDANFPEGETDLGTLFTKLAQICAKATGSSLGTLVTVAMMTLAKLTRGKEALDWADLSDRLAEVRDQMLARGGASLGDKTMVDMLDAVVQATAGVNNPETLGAAAERSAQETLEAFRGRQNKIGRARMFQERSVGLDDPGMLAFLALIRAVRQETAPNA
ncbi:MAG: dihydroxyacetone kinase subunit L [Pseudorhodobacter sp.]